MAAVRRGPNKIARILKVDKVLTPTAYDFRTNGVRHTNLNEEKPHESARKVAAL